MKQVFLLFLEVFRKNISCINMNWNECIICQEKTEEKLRYPKNRKNFDTLPVFREFLENISKFQNLDDMPVDLHFPKFSTQILFVKNFSWYHACHQKFTKSHLLEREKKQKKDKNDY